MTQIETLWGDMEDLDKIGALIDKQTKQAKGSINKGPYPTNEFRSLTVETDSPPEKWFSSHAHIVDIVSRYTMDIHNMKESYSSYLVEVNDMFCGLLKNISILNTNIKVLRSQLEEFKKKYKEDMSDLFKLIDSATEEETDGQ